MVAIVALLYLVVLPIGIAWAASFAVEKLLPSWGARRRLTVAALAAGLVPVAIPLAADLLGGEHFEGEVLPAVETFLVAALVNCLIFGLPAAWVRERKLAARNPPPDPKVFE